MAKYLILYNSTETAADQMAKASPEQMQASMNEWIQWKDEAMKTVGFEFGMPLQPVARIAPDSVAGSSSLVAGYSIMEGDSKDAVVDALKTHPHLKRPDATIDVLEMLSMPGL